jgi:phosphotriesterase-related protein
MALLDLFEAEGVDPSRVIIGHTDEHAIELGELAALAGRGAYVQFDVVGTTSYLLDDTRVDLLSRLVELGYRDRLLLSSDLCFPTRLRANGGPGYGQLLRTFVPKLRQAGFDEALLEQIMVRNPARILAFEAEEV